MRENDVMDYCMKVLAIGRANTVALSESEFLELKEAKRRLILFSSLTECYRVVVESYSNLEKVKHSTELDYMLSGRFDAESIVNTRITLNTPIMGYLSCARSFLDQVQGLKSKLLSEEEAEELKTFLSGVYDTSPHYALTEALRNHVQHRGLPIHAFGYQIQKDDTEDIKNSDVLIRARIRASKKLLSEDPKIKRSILEQMPDEIDLIECIRHHIQGIFTLHKYLLDTFSGYANEARDRISEAIRRFETETGETTLGLAAIEYEESTILKEVPLLLTWDDARLESIKKLGNLNNLPNRYVTGKIGNK